MQNEVASRKAIVRFCFLFFGACLFMGSAVAEQNLDVPRLAELAKPSILFITVKDAGGRTLGTATGFFVSANGFVATNFHVLEKAAKIVGKLADETDVNSSGVVALDPENDLAIIGFPMNATPLQLAETECEVGEKVVAIGNPLGLTGSVSDGIVAAKRPGPHKGGDLQITAPISPGSSGGPLLNASGKVVGITTFNLRGGQALNFAIPARSLNNLIRSISAGSEAKSFVDVIDQEENIVWQDDGFKAAVKAYAQGDYGRSLRFLNSLKNRFPQNGDVFFWCGLACWKLGKIEAEADSLRSCVKLRPDDFLAWRYLGGALSMLSKHDDATKAYETALKLNPEDEISWFELGALADATKQREKALTFLKRAVELNPRYASAWKRSAYIYVRLKQYGPAAEAFQHVVEINEKDWASWSRLGECYWRLGQLDQMIAAFQEVVKLRPDTSGAWAFIASGLGKKGQAQKAIEVYEQGVKAAPADPNLWLNLANAYKAQQRFADAERALAHANAVREEEAKKIAAAPPRAVDVAVEKLIRDYVRARNKPDVSEELSYFAPEATVGDVASADRTQLTMLLKSRRLTESGQRYELRKITDMSETSVSGYAIVKAVVAKIGTRVKTTPTLIDFWLEQQEDNRWLIILLREWSEQSTSPKRAPNANLR